MLKKWLINLSTMTAGLLLAACGSNESNIIGTWQGVADDEVGYFEFGEETIIARSPSEADNPMSADYRLRDTLDDKFIIEITNPETGDIEPLFEGYFENNNKIIMDPDPDSEAENLELIRVDSIEEAEERRLQEEEEEQRSPELERQEERNGDDPADDPAGEEEEPVGDNNGGNGGGDNGETADVDEDAQYVEDREQQPTANENSLRAEYMEKAENLKDEMRRDAEERPEAARDRGFYLQYHGDWDDLLNEVWGVLEETMPNDAFETLQSEQIEWIEMKEQNFDDMPHEAASARERASDYLAKETKDRTHYLIENYMD